MEQDLILKEAKIKALKESVALHQTIHSQTCKVESRSTALSKCRSKKELDSRTLKYVNNIRSKKKKRNVKLKVIDMENPFRLHKTPQSALPKPQVPSTPDNESNRVSCILAYMKNDIMGLSLKLSDSYSTIYKNRMIGKGASRNRLYTHRKTDKS